MVTLSKNGPRAAACVIAVLAIAAWWFAGATGGQDGSDGSTADPTERANFYTSRQSPVLTKASATGTSLVSWGFAGGPPTAWITYPGGRVQAASDGTLVRTSTGGSQYQLGSAPTRFETGEYTVILSGEVRAGGLQLGVLDVERNRWLANSFYWRGQRVASGLMATAFKVNRPMLVSIVLANWAPIKESSTWLIRDVFVKPGNQVPSTKATAAPKVGPPFGRATFRAPELKEPTPASLTPFLGNARALAEGPGTTWERAARVRDLVRGALVSTDSVGALAVGFWSVGSIVGLPLRLVIGTLNGQNLYDTHTTVEVWLEEEGRWAISDPTFNGYWTLGPDGPPLGVGDINQAIVSGQHREIHWHAAHTRNSLLPSSYYLNPLMLYRYYAIQGFVGDFQTYLTKDAAYVRAWGGISGSYLISSTLDLSSVPPDRPIEARRIPAALRKGGPPAGFEVPPFYADELLFDGFIEADARGQTVIELEHVGSVVVTVEAQASWKVVNRDAEYDLADVDGTELSPVVVVDSRRLGFRVDPAKSREARVRVWSVPPFPLTRER